MDGIASHQGGVDEVWTFSGKTRGFVTVQSMESANNGRQSYFELERRSEIVLKYTRVVLDK